VPMSRKSSRCSMDHRWPSNRGDARASCRPQIVLACATASRAGRRPRRGASTLRAASMVLDLLTPWSNRVRAVPTFEGGFTLEAAERVLDVVGWPDAPPVTWSGARDRACFAPGFRRCQPLRDRRAVLRHASAFTVCGWTVGPHAKHEARVTDGISPDSAPTPRWMPSPPAAYVGRRSRWSFATSWRPAGARACARMRPARWPPIVPPGK
jgi:hypothetical protein